MVSPTTPPERKALVLGWTGGIGMTIVRALAKSPTFTEVTLIGRKPQELPPSTPTSNYRKFTQKVVDFAKLTEGMPEFQALGETTAFYAIGIHTPSFWKNEGFYEVEYVNAMKLANLLKGGGCPEVHWILGQGTGTHSIFYFGRVKAQVQEEVGALGFSRVSFYHPGTVCTTDGRGLTPQYFINACNFLDRWRWFSLDGEQMGEFIVTKAALSKNGAPIQVYNHSDMI